MRTKCFTTTNNDNGKGLQAKMSPTMAYLVAMEKGECEFSQLQ